MVTLFSPQPLILAIALVVSGVAAAQQPPAVPPPTPFKPVISDPMLEPAPSPEQRVRSWQEAMDLLRSRSTDLRNAEAGVARAEGRWRQSLSSLLPNVRATATSAYDILNPDTPPPVVGAGNIAAAVQGRKAAVPTAVAGITLNQTLLDFGALRGLSSSSANKQSAEANLEDVRRRTTQGLARALVAVVAAERAAELNRLGLRQALERAALTQRTFELGAGTQLDVIRGQQDVAVARGALISGDEQLRRTREALGLALGLPTEVGVQQGFNLDGLLAETRAQCKELQPGELRADIRSANAQVESAAQSRAQAAAGYLPTLGLASGAYAVATDPPGARVTTWSIQAVLTVPIWEGGLRNGLIFERRGLETQAEQSAENVRRGEEIEKSRAQRGVDVADQLMRNAKDARDLAQRLDELTRKSFEIGRSTSLELVQSAVLLRQAELTLALREFELVQARLDAFLTEAQCAG